MNRATHGGRTWPRSWVSVFILLVVTLAALRIETQPALAAGPASDGQIGEVDGTKPSLPHVAAECVGISAITETECNVLVSLYLAAGGEQWESHTNWRNTGGGLTPCDWYGVVCAGGHVTQLNLSGNRLRGNLPDSFGLLDQLTHLNLADNQLRDPIPQSICALQNTLGVADFAYNQLISRNRKVRECMNTIDPDWFATQTVPPTQLRVDSIAQTSIDLAWQPIAYSGDGGYYEIGYATTINGLFSLHGVTGDKLADHYTVDGLEPGQTYFVRVRTVTPAHAAQESEQRSDHAQTMATTDSATVILVLVYFPADNDLSPYTGQVLNRLQKGTAMNPNVQVLVLMDRRGDHNTAVFEIAGDVITPTTVVEDVWGVDELDTADPAILAWFLTYGRASYPADITIASLMGHGVGLAPEFTWLVPAGPGEPLQPQNGIPALPQGHPATPGDETSNSGFLSPFDFDQALSAATGDGTDPFDLIFFDQCFMGNLDVLYQVRDTAKIFVASPNYAWLSAAYAAYLSQFAPAITVEEMANRLIYLYEVPLNDRHPNVIFWVRSEDITAIAAAVSELGATLQAALADGQESLILDAALASQYVDTTQCGRENLQLGPPDELMGATSFATQLRDRFPMNSAVYNAADTLMEKLSNVSSAVRTGAPYIAPDTVWEYQDRLTILAPLQRDLSADVVWRASIYKATAPLTATWSPVPTQTVSISETFAFVQDGQWDEFIDAWYTGDLQPTVGEWCSYIPPVLMTDAMSETIVLSGEAQNDRLQLTWSATAEDNAAEYWILARDGHAVNWTLRDTVALSTTAYALPLPLSTRGEYIVLAQNEEGETVAASNDAQWPPPRRTIYLPLLQR